MPTGGVACENGVENLIQLPSNNVRDYTVENLVKARHGRRREQSSVKEDDREFDGCQGHTIVEGICEDELELWQLISLPGKFLISGSLLTLVYFVGSVTSTKCLPIPRRTPELDKRNRIECVSTGLP